jgi:hypothetical protein
MGYLRDLVDIVWQCIQTAFTLPLCSLRMYPNVLLVLLFCVTVMHHLHRNRYERELLAYNAAKAAYITAQQAGGANGAASASGSAKKKKKVEKTDKAEKTAAVV